MLLSDLPWNITQVICIFSLCTLVYQENTSDKWDIPLHSKREHCMTILYHVIENTVANTMRHLRGA